MWHVLQVSLGSEHQLILLEQLFRPCASVSRHWYLFGHVLVGEKFFTLGGFVAVVHDEFVVESLHVGSFVESRLNCHFVEVLVVGCSLGVNLSVQGFWRIHLKWVELTVFFDEVDFRYLFVTVNVGSFSFVYVHLWSRDREDCVIQRQVTRILVSRTQIEMRTRESISELFRRMEEFRSTTTPRSLPRARTSR